MQLRRTTAKVPRDLEEVRQRNRANYAAQRVKLEREKADQATFHSMQALLSLSEASPIVWLR